MHEITKSLSYCITEFQVGNVGRNVKNDRISKHIPSYAASVSQSPRGRPSLFAVSHEELQVLLVSCPLKTRLEPDRIGICHDQSRSLFCGITVICRGINVQCRF